MARIRHIALCVKDIKATADFYEKAFGLKRKDKRGMPWQAYTEGHFGAVRADADRVIEIKCSEA